MEGLPYPDELKKHLQLSLSYFKINNIEFFNSNASFLKKYWHGVYLLPLFVIYFLPFTMYIVKIFNDGEDLFEKADMIPLWMISTQVLDRSANIVGWNYFLMPLVQTLIRKLVLAQEAEFALPVPYLYPFTVDNWPKYLAVYACQLYFQMLLVYMYIGTYILLVDLSFLVSIQFILLQEDLVNIKLVNRQERSVNYDEITVYQERSACKIKEFVKHHQEVILLTAQLNAIFNKIVFINLLFSVVIICFFAVAVKAATDMVYTVIFYSAIAHVMMTVFVMCYCSEMLSSSSSGIAEAAVKSMWYKGDLRYQTIICFIIMRSQNPSTLKALNFLSISMNTFNKVLKTTYSYFSLASQIYDERD